MLVGAIVFAQPPASYAGMNNEAQQEDAADMPGLMTDGTTGSYLSSQFARASGDIDGAIRYLRRVYKQEPDNSIVANQLLGALLIAGETQEATVIADRLRADEVNDPVVLLLKILREVKAGRRDAAIKLLDDAFETGANGQLWMPLIAAWLDTGPEDPMTIEQLSGNVGRMRPLLFYHLALINDFHGFTDAATANFKEAIEDPKNPPKRVMEGLLQFYDHHNAPSTLAPIVDAYVDAHSDEAVHPESVTIASVEDGITEVLFSMGSVMRTAGMTQDAVIYLQLALYLKKDLHEVAAILGDAYSDVHMYEAANRAYATVPADNLHFARAQMRLAVNLDRMGKTSAALSVLDKLAKRFPDNMDAIIAKADLLRMRGRYPDAVAAYTQALNRFKSMEADQWAIFYARAACLERQGKWRAAEQDLLKALELNPDQPDVLNYVGYSWLVRGEKMQEATDMIGRALKARPNDAQILDSMGWALYLQGEYAQAAGYLEKAIQLIPSDAVVNDHLGDAYWRDGRKTEARYQWERSQSFSPDKPLAAALNKKLKEGLPSLNPMSTKAPVVDAGDDTTPVP